MGKRTQSSQSPAAGKQGQGRQRRGETESAAVLAGLKERFAQFRAEHARGTRVPGELRAATLAALRKGVTAGDLYRSCGVSWGQLEAWKARRRSSRTRARERDGAPAEVRVFSVVDAEREPVHRPEPEAEPVRRPALVDPLEEELELRLGRWSVCVRHAEPARGG